MSIRCGKLQIGKESIGHRHVVMLAGMHHERKKLMWSLLHGGYDWRDLHEVWTSADNINDLEHNWICPWSVVRSRLKRLSVNSNLERPTTDNGLKSHGLRIDQRRMILAELVFRRSPLSALRVSTISGVSEQTRL